MEHEHFENQEHEWESNLKVTEGVEGPIQVNPNALERMKRNQQQLMPLEWYVDGILKGDRVALSKAITLVESALPKHQDLAQQIIAACLPHAGKALRLGITGVPGAGKSTFIEALGVHLCNKGQKLAVLAIDPSSQRSKGSILGDKTRMETLSVHPNAYIRPSASAGTLGGVARKTRETIILCEAAGYDTIFVETVGVGQSETAVHSMVDFFLLILISGAGDGEQGRRRQRDARQPRRRRMSQRVAPLPSSRVGTRDQSADLLRVDGFPNRRGLADGRRSRAGHPRQRLPI